MWKLIIMRLFKMIFSPKNAWFEGFKYAEEEITGKNRRWEEVLSDIRELENCKDPFDEGIKDYCNMHRCRTKNIEPNSDV